MNFKVKREAFLTYNSVTIFRFNKNTAELCKQPITRYHVYSVLHEEAVCHVGYVHVHVATTCIIL